MDPLTVAAVAKGVGALAGGLSGFFGSGQSRQARANSLARMQTEKWNQKQLDFARHQLAVQDRQFQQSMERQNAQFAAQRADSTRAYYKGLQDRVADAKAAGLHPLFALGTSAANISPAFNAGGIPQGSASAQFIPGQSPVGSFAQEGASKAAGIADALTGVGHSIERLYQQARQDRLDEAQLAESKARTRAYNSAAEVDLARSQALSSRQKTGTQVELTQPASATQARQASNRNVYREIEEQAKKDAYRRQQMDQAAAQLPYDLLGFPILPHPDKKATGQGNEDIEGGIIGEIDSLYDVIRDVLYTTHVGVIKKAADLNFAIRRMLK